MPQFPPYRINDCINFSPYVFISYILTKLLLYSINEIPLHNLYIFILLNPFPCIVNNMVYFTSYISFIHTCPSTHSLNQSTNFIIYTFNLFLFMLNNFFLFILIHFFIISFFLASSGNFPCLLFPLLLPIPFHILHRPTKFLSWHLRHLVVETLSVFFGVSLPVCVNTAYEFFELVEEEFFG
ncbi:MAG: hypothetical protein DDT19_01907 [Syntrophomonadaceae bacterium]|nr:hypothetical protein [Bacillota bacterium]